MDFKRVDEKGTLEAVCLMKSVEKRISSKGAPYLDIIIADKDEEMAAKLWDYREGVHDNFAPGDIVKIRGGKNLYNGTEQFKIDRVLPVTAADGVRIEDYVPSAPYTGEAMLAEVEAAAASLADRELKALAFELIGTYREKLLYWPAAFKLHHAVRGGLLYHTLAVLRLAEAVCGIYPFVDRDLLVAGVILHDIMKIDEFEVPNTGLASGYTAAGQLVGHLVGGAAALEKAGEKLGISGETLLLLEHMLLSHHGDPDFGAAVRPLTLEAEILSQLDMLDARVYQIAHALEQTEQGAFTQRQWAMEDRKFYQHGRVRAKPEAALIPEK